MVAGRDHRQDVVTLSATCCHGHEAVELVATTRSWCRSHRGDAALLTPTKMSARSPRHGTGIAGERTLTRGLDDPDVMASGNATSAGYPTRHLRPTPPPATTYAGTGLHASDAHLAFGGGRHFCAGRVGRRMELTNCPYRRCLDQFPRARLDRIRTGCTRGQKPAPVWSLRGRR